MAWGTPRRGNHFNAKPVIIDGVRYASTAEGDYTLVLRGMVADGRLQRWMPHPKFMLLDRLSGAPGKSTKGKGRDKVLLARFAGRAFTFTLDYQVWPDPVSGAETAVLDRKGGATMTPDFFLRAGIFVRVHGIPLYAVLDDGTWVRA